MLSAASSVGGAAQERAEPAHTAASVTLEQLPAPAAAPAGAGQTADLEVPQPSRPAPGSTVIVSDVPGATDRAALTTFPVVGTDICEQSGQRSPSDLCRQRIETRAAQFARPRAQPVSSEGRLLIVTDPNGRAGGQSVGQRAVDGRDASGLDAISGQLAGALQTVDAATQMPGDPGAAAPSALPAGAPPIVVLPGK